MPFDLDWPLVIQGSLILPPTPFKLGLHLPPTVETSSAAQRAKLFGRAFIQGGSLIDSAILLLHHGASLIPINNRQKRLARMTLWQ
jgi:hypothetical protein